MAKTAAQKRAQEKYRLSHLDQVRESKRRTRNRNRKPYRDQVLRWQRENPEWVAYRGAKQRCLNPNHSRFADWGGRGIEFRFESYQQFLVCVGRRPGKGYMLDRIDNDGHYEPGNVRWVTARVSANNQRGRATVDIETKEIRQAQRTEDKDMEIKSGARSPEVRTPVVNRDLGDETEEK
jgi:hypothetical protein